MTVDKGGNWMVILFWRKGHISSQIMQTDHVSNCLLGRYQIFGVVVGMTREDCDTKDCYEDLGVAAVNLVCFVYTNQVGS